jgi:hypothetical protein
LEQRLRGAVVASVACFGALFAALTVAHDNLSVLLRLFPGILPASMLLIFPFETVELADRPRQWRLSSLFFVVSGLAIVFALIRLALEYLRTL